MLTLTLALSHPMGEGRPSYEVLTRSRLMGEGSLILNGGHVAIY